MADNTYVAKGTHLDAWLTDEEKKLVDSYKQQWETAKANDDIDGMGRAHAAAEQVRANSSNPYSGGDDGSEFIPLPYPADDDGLGGGLGGGLAGGGYGGGTGAAAASGYNAAMLPKARNLENYINSIYAAQEDLALQQLKSEYEKNVLQLDDAASKIPAEFTVARNSASGDNEIAKSAFNERAAAHGLNSGTGSQATLSMNNALLGNLARISSDEAVKKSEAELMRAELKSAYSANISKALAENNLQKASALYKELVRLDEAEYSRALAQANENYKAYQTSLR